MHFILGEAETHLALCIKERRTARDQIMVVLSNPASLVKSKTNEKKKSCLKCTMIVKIMKTCHVC